MTETNQIAEFWSWFSANVTTVSEAYENGDTSWLDSHLSTRVKLLAPDLNWEIGPYFHPESTFVLSPVKRENLSLTRSAVENAPALEGWRFLHAKPRKVLSSLTFESDGYLINADGWSYQMTAYNGGEFVDIELFIPVADRLPAGHELLFCELAVESLVGEELRLDRVGYLHPRALTDDTSTNGMTEIKYLYDHLLSILNPSPNAA